MITEETTHGFKVLTDDGNEELAFFNTLKEAEDFIKENVKECEE